MKDKSKKVNNNKSWAIGIAITTFILSLFFSFISNTVISNLNIIIGVIVLFLVILIGIGFDLIGVAVTVANEEHFVTFNAHHSRTVLTSSNFMS